MPRDSHILKIVNHGRTFNPNVGVTCFPRQTYGLSEDAPHHFKSPHSLTAEHGYIFKYDEEGERNPEQPLSQRKYCSVVGQTIDVVDSFRDTYDECAENPATFRRRKGRLSEFMDKNGWMNKVVKIMGFQRTDEAREASNKDRQARIHSLKPRINYDNPAARKPLPKENFATLSLYTEKAKIRTQRYSLHSRKKGDLDLQRSLQVRTPQEDFDHSQKKFLEAEAMTNKMASTMQEKEWRSTMSTIRKKHGSPSKKRGHLRESINSAREMNLTFDDWSKNVKQEQKREEAPRDELKDWFNSTCNSGADAWKYRKPRKVDTQSSQEINGPED